MPSAATAVVSTGITAGAACNEAVFWIMNVNALAYLGAATVTRAGRSTRSARV